MDKTLFLHYCIRFGPVAQDIAIELQTNWINGIYHDVLTLINRLHQFLGSTLTTVDYDDDDATMKLLSLACLSDRHEYYECNIHSFAKKI